MTRIHARSRVTTASLAALVSGVSWVLAPTGEQIPPLVGLRQDTWQQPALPRPADQTAVAALVVGAALWGGAPAAAADAPAPDVDTRWRISSVFGDASKRGVLVSFGDESKPVQRLFVGDNLPGGHRITSINERDVCVQIGKQSYRLGLERRDP